METPAKNADGHDDPRSNSDRAWDTFVESRPESGFTQASWWSDFLLTRGWDNFGVVIHDGDSIVGGARVMRYEYAPDHCFYYVPEGPVLPANKTDAAEVFQAIVEFVAEKSRADKGTVSHLRFEPRWCKLPTFFSGFIPARDWFEPRNTLCLNLSLSEQQFLSQMKPKGRYNVRVARRLGVSIVQDVPNKSIDDFWTIYKETVDRKEISGKNQEYFSLLIPTLFKNNRARIYFAEYQQQRIAAVLAVYFGDRVTYFFGGSRATHRNVMAPYLLHFEIARQAREIGYQWYDMYGIAPATKPDDPWSKISDFKRKFGGEEIKFVPAQDFVYDSGAYEKYHEHRKKRRQ